MNARILWIVGIVLVGILLSWGQALAAWISYVYVPGAVRILPGEYETIPALAEFDWHVWSENNVICGAISCADRGHSQGYWVYDKVVNRGIENETGQRFHVRTGKTYLAPHSCDPWYYGVGICNSTGSWQIKNYVTQIGMDASGLPSNSAIRLGECHYENLSLAWSGVPPGDRVDLGSAVACFEAAGTAAEIGVGFLGRVDADPLSEAHY